MNLDLCEPNGPRVNHGLGVSELVENLSVSLDGEVIGRLDFRIERRIRLRL